MTNPEPAAPQQPNPGRFLLWGVLLGLVLIPLAVFGVMQILNATVFDCYDSGAEGSLSCVLRTLAITAMSSPVGAVIGFFVAYWAGSRRFRMQSTK
jgi:ABC-type Fe3+ transport system permease subunit